MLPKIVPKAVRPACLRLFLFLNKLNAITLHIVWSNIRITEKYCRRFQISHLLAWSNICLFHKFIYNLTIYNVPFHFTTFLPFTMKIPFRAALILRPWRSKINLGVLDSRALIAVCRSSKVKPLMLPPFGNFK